jgi:IS1 family transposase
MRWHPQQQVNFAVLEKKNKLWIWLAFDRSASSTGNVAIVMPPR